MHNKKEKGELFLQEPPEGPFDHKALQWQAHTAYIPYHRVKDFIQGEENRKGFPTKFHKCQKHENVQGSLKRRVDGETYLEKMCYHCSFGPDMGSKKKKKGGDSKDDSTDGEQQQQKELSEEDGVKAGAKGEAGGEEEDGEVSNKPKKKSSSSSSSKKRGCLCNFEVRKLYLQPSVARLTYECFDHVNPEGVICHGAVDSGGSGSRPSSVSSPEEKERERERAAVVTAVAAAHTSDQQAFDFEAASVSVAIPAPVPEHVATLVPEPVANPLQAEAVVVQSNPVVPVHFKSFEEMLRIESRLKAMLYNHPPLVVNYCALLEEIEGKLIEIITSKQNSVVATPVVLPSPTNTVSTGLGLNVMDAMDQDSITFKSMQYPPAPPVRFPSAAPAPGVDWLRIVDSGSKFSSEYIPPAPAPKNGSDHWKKFMGGRQQQQQPHPQPEAQAQPQQPPSVASIYIPPAPPVRGNPGGYDWEKALAESSSRHSHLSHQQSPSTLGGNAHAAAGFGFGSSSKPVVVGSNSNSKHKPSSTTVIEIPPAPPFKANPVFGLTNNNNGKQAHAHDGNPKLVRKSAEQPVSYAAPIKRHRPLLGVPSRAPPEHDGVTYPFSSLPRPTPFLTGKITVVRTSSDADEQRDTSEDTSST